MKPDYESVNVAQIKEADLPEDWHEEVVRNFSRMARTYSSHIQKTSGYSAVNSSVDLLLADLIVSHGYKEIVDIGVGDGARLAGIRTRLEARGHSIRPFGTDLSDEMVEQARNRGIISLKHDMRKPLDDSEKGPFSEESLDMILYLSGDFGYLMDKENGFDLRVAALKSAYRALRTGGMLFMDLMAQDNSNQWGDETQDDDDSDHNKDGRVWVYERTPVAGTGNDAMQFYLKMFRFGEIRKLIKASPFNVEKADAAYMILGEPQQDGSFDFSRAGTVSHSFPCFQGFDVKLIHPTVEDVNSRTAYQLLVTAIRQ